MAREFFYAVSYSAMMNLHLKVLYGENDHHKLEAMFKAFAKALDAATRRDAPVHRVLSHKGRCKGRCSAAGTTGAYRIRPYMDHRRGGSRIRPRPFPRRGQHIH